MEMQLLVLHQPLMELDTSLPTRTRARKWVQRDAPTSLCSRQQERLPSVTHQYCWRVCCQVLRVGGSNIVRYAWISFVECANADNIENCNYGGNDGVEKALILVDVDLLEVVNDAIHAIEVVSPCQIQHCVSFNTIQLISLTLIMEEHSLSQIGGGLPWKWVVCTWHSW